MLVRSAHLLPPALAEQLVFRMGQCRMTGVCFLRCCRLLLPSTCCCMAWHVDEVLLVLLALWFIPMWFTRPVLWCILTRSLLPLVFTLNPAL